MRPSETITNAPLWLLQLCKTYRVPMTELMLKGYMEALEDFSQTEIADAVKLATREYDRMPTPAQIRKALRAKNSLGAESSSWHPCGQCDEGWVFVNEHWFYPIVPDPSQKSKPWCTREFHDRSQVGKRWVDEGTGMEHQIREAVISCTCRSSS